MYTAGVTLTTGRVLIYDAIANGGPARVAITVPVGGAAVTIGDVNKSTPTSLLCNPGTTYVDVGPNDKLYGTVATSTQAISVYAYVY